MREVRYRATARSDLRAIADYYGNIDPDVADQILADIEQAIAWVREYPHLGQAIGGGALHGKLTRRYRFKIIYSVTRDAIMIAGVFRFQNRQS